VISSTQRERGSRAVFSIFVVWTQEGSAALLKWCILLVAIFIICEMKETLDPVKKSAAKNIMKYVMLLFEK